MGSVLRWPNPADNGTWSLVRGFYFTSPGLGDPPQLWEDLAVKLRISDAKPETPDVTAGTPHIEAETRHVKIEIPDAKKRRHRRRRRSNSDGRGRDDNDTRPAVDSKRPRRTRDTVGGAGELGQGAWLRWVADDVKVEAPRVLQRLGTANLAVLANKVSERRTPPLNPELCPQHLLPVTVRVLNGDAVNIAIDMAKRAQDRAGNPVVPLVVNFANATTPGGGWANGALAQEETIFNRSSLYLSLHHNRYPIARDSIVYSPYVLVFRDDIAAGYPVMAPPATPDYSLPVISVASVAALSGPALSQIRVRDGQGKAHNIQVYASAADRTLTKLKMRLTLRAAARNGHTHLVLGALGCGKFRNPPHHVAQLWREVLAEPEFNQPGRWWQEIVFAVYDLQCLPGGNYAIFHSALDGLVI